MARPGVRSEATRAILRLLTEPPKEPPIEVQREEEAIFLRKRVAGFINDVESRSMSPERRHLETKSDLLRALLLVLCPGSESLRAVSLPSRAFTAFVNKPGKVIVSAPA